MRKVLQHLAFGPAQGKTLSQLMELCRLEEPALVTLLQGMPDVLQEKGLFRLRAESQDQLTGLSSLRIYHPEQHQQQSALYLIFRLVVGAGAAGVTYKEIVQQYKGELDELSASHYCRTLAALRLVKVESKGNCRKIVSSYFRPVAYSTLPLELAEGGRAEYLEENCLLLEQLGTLQNVLLNCSSLEAHREGGITRQNLYLRTNKSAQKKMISRLLQKHKVKGKAERLGKKFLFRFLEQDPRIQRIVDSPCPAEEKRGGRLAPEAVRLLAQFVNKNWHKYEQFVENNFSQLEQDSLRRGEFGFTDLSDSLLRLVCEVVEYREVKQTEQMITKRQGTPAKLARYCLMINQVLERRAIAESDLRGLVVEAEKGQDIGLVHKRTMLTALKTIERTGLIKLVDYNSRTYALWHDESPAELLQRFQRERAQREQAEREKEKQKEKTPRKPLPIQPVTSCLKYFVAGQKPESRQPIKLRRKDVCFSQLFKLLVDFIDNSLKQLMREGLLKLVENARFQQLFRTKVPPSESRVRLQQALGGVLDILGLRARREEEAVLSVAIKEQQLAKFKEGRRQIEQSLRAKPFVKMSKLRQKYGQRVGRLLLSLVYQQKVLLLDELLKPLPPESLDFCEYCRASVSLSV